MRFVQARGDRRLVLRPLHHNVGRAVAGAVARGAAAAQRGLDLVGVRLGVSASARGRRERWCAGSGGGSLRGGSAPFGAARRLLSGRRRAQSWPWSPWPTWSAGTSASAATASPPASAPAAARAPSRPASSTCRPAALVLPPARASTCRRAPARRGWGRRRRAARSRRRGRASPTSAARPCSARRRRRSRRPRESARSAPAPLGWVPSKKVPRGGKTTKAGDASRVCGSEGDGSQSADAARLRTAAARLSQGLCCSHGRFERAWAFYPLLSDITSAVKGTAASTPACATRAVPISRNATNCRPPFSSVWCLLRRGVPMDSAIPVFSTTRDATTPTPGERLSGHNTGPQSALCKRVAFEVRRLPLEPSPWLCRTRTAAPRPRAPRALAHSPP